MHAFQRVVAWSRRINLMAKIFETGIRRDLLDHVQLGEVVFRLLTSLQYYRIAPPST